MERPHRRAAALEGPADLEQAAGVAGHHAGGPAGLDPGQLAVQDRRGDFGQTHRERAAEAAAFVAARQVDEVGPAEVLENRSRTPRLPEPAEQVAGVVIGDRSGDLARELAATHDL